MQLLLCEQPNQDHTPCHLCSSCLRLASDNHPAVTYLTPEGASLKIAQMRAAMKQDRFGHRFGDRAIIVVTRTETMTVEAATSVLKWVEEPYQDRLFLLLTSSAMMVLPTLRSRCTTLTLSQSYTKNALNDLFASFGYDLLEERSIRILQAAQQLYEALAHQREDLWHFPVDTLIKWSESSDFSVLFQLMMGYCRDAIAVQVGNRPYFYEDTKAFAQLASHLGIKRWSELALLFGDLGKRMRAHVNGLTALEAALFKVSE